MKKIKKNQRGFTLIEMMISMVVFTIFMGTLFNSYTSIISLQQNSSDVRKMYASARDLFDVLAEDVRLSTVDYYYYSCESGDLSEELALLSRDGLGRTIYKLFDEDKGVSIKKWKSFRTSIDEGFASADDDDFEAVSSGELIVKDFKFAISPEKDPYSKSSVGNFRYQLQPQVTLLAQFTTDSIRKKIDFPLQTTISSRVYTKVDQRDRIEFGGEGSCSA